MSLKSRAQWLLLAVFGAQLLVLALLMHFGLNRAIDSLDRKDTLQHLASAQQAVRSEAESLLVSVDDYAGWDDSYQFMVDHNQEYISSNLEFPTLQNLNVDSMIYLDMQGRVFHYVNFDEGGKPILRSPSVTSAVTLPNPQRTKWDGVPGMCGVALLDGRLTMYAAHPIIPTSNLGRARGMLVMTRILRQSEISSYAHILGVPLSILTPADPDLPAAVQAQIKNSERLPGVINLGKGQMIGFSVLHGRRGEAVGVFRISNPRGYAATARSFELLLVLVLLSTLALTAAMSGKLLSRWLLEPMAQLRERIAAVGSSGEPGSRVGAVKHTELAELARSFDATLERLATSQEQLSASQALFKRLYNHTPVMMCSVDREGRILNANEFLLRTLGYEPGEVQGQRLVELMTPAARHAAVNEMLPRFMDSGMCTQQELLLERRDGSTLAVLFHCVAEFDEHGRVAGALSMMTDISQLKKAQADAERYASEMRAITAAFPDLYFKMNIEGRFLEAIGGHSVFGDTSRLRGRHYSEINPPEATAKLDAAFEQLRQGQNAPPIEYRLRIDGRPSYFEARFQLLPDRKVLLIVRDISERRDAQQALQESEERYRQLVEMAQEGIAQVDADDRILFANPAYCRALGYSEEELIGTRVFDYLDATGCETIHQRNEERRRGQSSSYELRMRTKSGESRDFLVNATPIFDESGDFCGAFAVNTDITDLKRSQQAMAATQRLESLGVLAGGIAHDFNNLLAGILGNASLAAESAPEHSDTAGYLADIMAASRRAGDLTRQILTYAGKGRLNPQRFDVNAEIRQMARLIDAAVRKGVEISYELSPEPIFIEADQAQFSQIVMNLVINASEAVDRNGGRVLLRTNSTAMQSPELRSAQTNWELESGRYLCLEVIDNGCGMDEATQAKVFDPFYTTKFTGRGLGLAAVLGIIRVHSGALHLESAPGTGTRFAVYLPQNCEQVLPAAAVDFSPAAVQNHGRILVVDDEPMVLNLADAILSRQGYTVERAADASIALDKFGSEPGDYALVLLDMTMPGMTGAEAFERFKALRRDIPVVLCSGFGEEEVYSRFEQMHPEGFVKKPYLPADLLRTVNLTLQRQLELQPA